MDTIAGTVSQRERLTAESVTSSDGALARLSEREFDAVVAEIRPPTIDGLDLLDTIRIDQGRDLPVVIFTSESEADIAIEALNRDADRYVRKQGDLRAKTEELADVLLSEIESYQQRRQRELFGEIVEELDDPVVYQNLDGEFEVVNRAVAEYANRPKSELIGADEYAFMDEQAADAIEAKKDRVIDEETALTYEVRPSFPEAGTRWFSTLRYPHYDGNGQVDGTVAICRDVSELKHKEQALRRERDRLEEFASFVSHDLRNPLDAASARLELLGENCESPHIEDIETNLEHMEQLVTDLLSLAQQGDVVGSVEPVALQAAVERAWENTETDNVGLHVEGDPVVRADPDRITTLLENLFQNADQHSDGDVTVVVGELENGFFVADNGPGIPPDERDTVFESGYSTDKRGTGFGLAIVRQIVEAHGWAIAIADSEYGGARFEITGVEAVEP
ncbi:Signal transduction histidine kinase [Halapricum desulfuricans]|uniref:histidine kinase n=1 Tax=Halapricum desulfuricans TaxID=2841257 RepID=A0A897MZW1_9EURY|nr:Signal transduction histidine kinase [Halapricum desulfuricans]